MASANSLIIRNAKSRQRIADAIKKLNGAGVAIPEPPTSKDKAVAAALQLEHFAEALELVIDHIAEAEKPKPKPKPAKK